jgi:hypothetical protein
VKIRLSRENFQTTQVLGVGIVYERFNYNHIDIEQVNALRVGIAISFRGTQYDYVIEFDGSYMTIDKDYNRIDKKGRKI